MSYNNIGNEGAIALANGLQGNSTLIELNLDCNSIGNEGAIALANALKDNSTLITLDLRENKIGDDGAEALANALDGRWTLAFLHLRNNIGDWSVSVLTSALSFNNTLTKLKLSYNYNIGYEGAMALANALKSNRVELTND